MPLSGTPIVAKYFRVRKVTTNTGNVGMSEFQMRCDEAHLYLTTTSHVRCTSPYCKITIETEIPNSLTVIEGHVQVPTPPIAMSMHGLSQCYGLCYGRVPMWPSRLQISPSVVPDD